MVRWTGNYTTTDHTDYTEVTIHSGRLLIVIEDGDTFENYLFDQTNPGAYVSILTQTRWRATPPQGFTIRNIGLKGKTPKSGGPAIVASCRDEALIENVYLGDGVAGYPASSSWNDWTGAIRSSPEHSGHLTWRGIHASGWVDNALYCSPPASPGPGNGTFTVENCYAVNNQISCYRFGTQTEMRNCYGRTKSGDHRVLWVYSNSSRASDAHVRAEDCVFDSHNGRAIITRSSASKATLTNTQYTGHSGSGSVSGGQLTPSPKRLGPHDVGAPASAEEAASGAGSGDGGSAPSPSEPTYEHSITFEGEGEYFFATQGGAIARGYGEGPYGIDETTVRGTVDGEAHTYHYNTYLSDVGVHGEVEARINGSFEPTWSMYPVDGYDREWLGDWPPEDGTVDPPLDEPKLEDLLKEIEALEAENADLHGTLTSHADALEDLEAQTGATHAEVTGLRERLVAWLTD